MRIVNRILRGWLSPLLAGFHAAAAASVGTDEPAKMAWLLGCAVLLMVSILPFETWLKARRTARQPIAEPAPELQPATA